MSKCKFNHRYDMYLTTWQWPNNYNKESLILQIKSASTCAWKLPLRWQQHLWDVQEFQGFSKVTYPWFDRPISNYQPGEQVTQSLTILGKLI